MVCWWCEWDGEGGRGERMSFQVTVRFRLVDRGGGDGGKVRISVQAGVKKVQLPKGFNLQSTLLIGSLSTITISASPVSSCPHSRSSSYFHLAPGGIIPTHSRPSHQAQQARIRFPHRRPRRISCARLSEGTSGVSWRLSKITVKEGTELSHGNLPSSNGDS